MIRQGEGENREVTRVRIFMDTLTAKPSEAGGTLNSGCGVARFQPREVPLDLLEAVLEAGCQTPSPWNLRPWQFIVVRSEMKREQLLRNCVEPGPAATAPVLIVGIANPKAWKQAPERLAELVRQGTLSAGKQAVHLGRIHRQWSVGDAARVFAIAQTHAALQQISAAAADHNLCTYWVHEFDSAALSRVLHLPETLVLVGIMALGYCAESVAVPAPSLARSIFAEAYGLPWQPGPEAVDAVDDSEASGEEGF